MCLILLASRVLPHLPLLVAANRDEWRNRPAAPAAWWEDAPEVLAGRDLQRGGTWMGVARDGRWAALTNLRDPAPPRRDGASRGTLVADYLRGGMGAAAYLGHATAHLAEWDGFNLLLGDGEGVHYLTNHRGGEVRLLPPGIYGLSNAPLGTIWPKTERGAEALGALLEEGREPSDEAVFEVLADAEPAPDDLLPDTGVGDAWERALSSLFIDTAEYGTRASTVLRMGAEGTIRLAERSFGPGGTLLGEVTHRFAAAPVHPVR